MPAVARRSSRRRAIVAIVAAATLAFGVLQASPAIAGQGYREDLLQLINVSRERHDLRALRLNHSLSRDAMKHTRKMLRRDRVFDPPNLEEILSRYPMQHLGAAAVGCGATIRQLHRALMNSEVHRSILLHPRLSRVGIGVIEANEANRCGRGSFWVTELFYG